MGIATGVFKSDLEKTVRNSLQTTIKRSNEEDMRAWNEIQRKLTCCGIDYPSDWSTMSATKSLPPSCCHSQYIDEEVGHCTESLPLGRDKYYQVKLIDLITSQLKLTSNTKCLCMLVGRLPGEAQGAHRAKCNRSHNSGYWRGIHTDPRYNSVMLFGH